MDALTTAITIGQWIFNAIVGLGMLWISRKANRMDKLEAEVKAKAEMIVEAKITTMKVSHDGDLREIRSDIQRILNRLERGDRQFDDLARHYNENQVKLITAVSQLKDFIRETTADRNQLGKLIEDVTKIKIQIAGLPCDRCEGGQA